MKSLLLNLLYGFARLLHASYRYRFHGLDHLAAARVLGRQSYVFAIWHQNLFAGILAQTGTRHVVIVSRSSDGEPVAYLCNRLGHHAARGSSRKGLVDKGGKLAKDEMIGVLKTGVPGAITVDGPRGPCHEVKPGIVEMARQAGIPIVAYVPIARRYWTFGSWDGFRLPKPFTRIDVYYGAPLCVACDTAFDGFAAIQQKLKGQLNAIELAHQRRNTTSLIQAEDFEDPTPET